MSGHNSRQGRRRSSPGDGGAGDDDGDGGPAQRRTRVFWGRAEMDALLTWIETHKPDCIGHGRREDCVRIKLEVFPARADYNEKTIKEKLLNMEKKFKKAGEMRARLLAANGGVEDEAVVEKVDKLCPFYERIERLKRLVGAGAGQTASPASGHYAMDADDGGGMYAPGADVQQMTPRLPKGQQHASSPSSSRQPTRQSARQKQRQLQQEQQQQDRPQPLHVPPPQRNLPDSTGSPQQQRFPHVALAPLDGGGGGGGGSSSAAAHNTRRSSSVGSSFTASSASDPAARSAGTATTHHTSNPSMDSTGSVSGSAALVHHHQQPPTSLSSTPDFGTLVNLLARRESRLAKLAGERLALERRRAEYAQEMERRRLEIEERRYSEERARMNRLEDLLLGLAGVVGPAQPAEQNSHTTATTAAVDSVAATAAGDGHEGDKQ